MGTALKCGLYAQWRRHQRKLVFSFARGCRLKLTPGLGWGAPVLSQWWDAIGLDLCRPWVRSLQLCEPVCESVLLHQRHFSFSVFRWPCRIPTVQSCHLWWSLNGFSWDVQWLPEAKFFPRLPHTHRAHWTHLPNLPSQLLLLPNARYTDKDQARMSSVDPQFGSCSAVSHAVS